MLRAADATRTSSTSEPLPARSTNDTELEVDAVSSGHVIGLLPAISCATHVRQAPSVAHEARGRPFERARLLREPRFTNCARSRLHRLGSFSVGRRRSVRAECEGARERGNKGPQAFDISLRSLTRANVTARTRPCKPAPDRLLSGFRFESSTCCFGSLWKALQWPLDEQVVAQATSRLQPQLNKCSNPAPQCRRWTQRREARATLRNSR